MIFSSIYTSGQNFFFDAGVNMLNVAVSRVKHSFLVFGDMTIFSEDGEKPSNLLARYLFSSKNNLIQSPLNIIRRN